MTTTADRGEDRTDTAGGDPPNERPAKPKRRAVRRALLAAVLVAAALGGGAGYYRLRWLRTITVTVGDRPVQVRRHHPGVRDALAVAHRGLVDGRELSVVTHRVLQADADPARVWVNGVPAGLDDPLRDGDRITVADGVDQTEGLTSGRDTGPYMGLPDVERSLWRTGVREIDITVTGARSGEVVARTPLVPGVPARPETERVVALTFDDGPNPRWTPAILDVLNAKAVRATFCTVGYAGQRYPELIKLEQADNEVPCDHTVDHIVPLSKRPTSQIADQIWKQADFLQTTLGTDPVLFRSPGGDVSGDRGRGRSGRGR